MYQYANRVAWEHEIVTCIINHYHNSIHGICSKDNYTKHYSICLLIELHVDLPHVSTQLWQLKVSINYGETNYNTKMDQSHYHSHSYANHPPVHIPNHHNSKHLEVGVPLQQYEQTEHFRSIKMSVEV